MNKFSWSVLELFLSLNFVTLETGKIIGLSLLFEWVSVPTDIPEASSTVTSYNTSAQDHRAFDFWENMMEH